MKAGEKALCSTGGSNKTGKGKEMEVGGVCLSAGAPRRVLDDVSQGNHQTAVKVKPA